MDNLFLWMLIFLSILAAVAVYFVISKKSLHWGYILGLFLIFLFWHTVAVVTMVAPDAIPGRIQESDPGDGFDMLFGDLICLMAVFFTILSAALARISGWLSSRGETLKPARRSMAVIGLAGLLIILTRACVAGLYRLDLMTTGFYFSDLGYWHWRIVRHGFTPLFVVDGILLLLILAWVGSTWVSRKRSLRGY